MRCEEFETKVEDYFDGELSEIMSELLTQHLSVCKTCASLYTKLETEQELYLRYECDVSPAPAFWDNVMARASQEDATHRSWPLTSVRGWLGKTIENFNVPRFSTSLTALIVLAAIGVTIGVMRYANLRERSPAANDLSQNESAPARVSSPLPDGIAASASPLPDDEMGEQGSNQDGREPTPLVSKDFKRKNRVALTGAKVNAARISLSPSPSVRNPTSDELVREAEQKYVEAIVMLSRDVNRRRTRLDSETAAQFERTLIAVDRTIADTRRAVRKHPGDPLAAKYMLTAYARKVDVLREMVGH
jgi:hypothetical protein